MKRAAMMMLTVMLTASMALAGKIGYIEDFSLAEDRAKPLKQLIPGTEDYYYYHCLHYLNIRRFDQVENLLPLWIKRYKHTGRVREIRNRLALLTYDHNPAKSLEFIRWRLGLHFNHQRQVVRKPQLPTKLKQNLISRRTLTARARRNYRNLQGFEDSALQWLAGMALDDIERRHLLQRLKRPDVSRLVRLVIDDLNYKDSRGFGSHSIHRQMLRSQLDELVRRKSILLKQTHFINAYLTKLQPGADEDRRHDRKVIGAHLDTMWSFVRRLVPAHNSLKAHVLYHKLVFDRARGVYDKRLFMTYVKLPRPVGYMDREYLRRVESRRWRVNLNADFRRYTLLPPVRNDEPLVRSYLMHFFVKEDDYKPYMEYVNDIYLKECFAETKITGGIGDPETWYSLLPPAKYKALKERVDIDFAYTNKKLFRTDDDRVHLDLDIKNVETLIVKVYEINALNYYRERRREVDTTINLDGLVANHEKVHKLAGVKDRPLLRVRRGFDFPQIPKRGMYVIEFIGNGKSSRALVRKGKLRYLSRTSVAGHVFTVLDESHRKVNDARLWVAGHEYAPDKDGTITVPFTNSRGPQKIILIRGDFASLDEFSHETENYRLRAGIHVEREALLKGKKAAVVIRPALYVNGTPVALSILEEVTLVIRSVDHDGVATSKEVADFKLFEDRESVYEFNVPDRLSSIRFTLKAKVKNLSRNKKENVAAMAAFSLNGIDRVHKVEDLHLSHVAGRWVVDLLGKTGEIKPERPVWIWCKHRDFRQTVHASLQSDRAGRVDLGPLKDIVWVRARGPEGTSHTWHLPRDGRSYPANVNGKVGEAIHIAYMGTAKAATRAELSLLETRGGTFVKDWFGSLKIRGGFLLVDDLPAGDYDLRIKPDGPTIRVRLTGGNLRRRYVLSDNRHLEVKNPRPLQITSVKADKDKVTIRLANATKFARVHVAAVRFAPQYPIVGGLGAIPFAEPQVVGVGKLDSVYVAGRDIGDEYRYIIERRYARKFAGNMLKRAGLLLNPWAIRTTKGGRQVAARGGRYARKGKAAAAKRFLAFTAGPAGKRGDNFANLDFLAEQGVLLRNLRPDKNGVVTIDRKDLGSHQQIHILAADPLNTVWRELALAEIAREVRDLRLIRIFDPAKHFTEQKQVTPVRKGGKLVIENIDTSNFEAYDSLARVYALYVTLSRNPTLVEFSFILNWPKMKLEQKREKYSKYACHELNFFLYNKDRDFFNAVVLPYLRNKKDKTFMDHWLIGADRRKLSGYLKPWAHAQLNIVERILLGRRIRRERPHTRRAVKDLFDLIPPNIDRFNHLFRTALKGRALEVADAYGFRGAKLATKLLRDAEAKGEFMSRLGAVGGLANGPGTRAARRKAPALTPPGPAKAKEAAAETLRRPAEEAKKRLGKDEAQGIPLAELAHFDADDLARRERVRQLYRKLDKTKEWVENNYYHLPIERQNASLITVNPFWNDYAAHDGDGPFLSANLAEASRNFPEMMLALAVLDLPFEPEKHKTEHKAGAFTLQTGSDTVVFHKEIKEAAPLAEKLPILVSQNFFRHGDRYRHVNNERLDKFVTDEFLSGVVYGCHLVITNPTSSRQKLEVLLQIPQGAMPVARGKYTRSVRVDLQAYHTKTLEYYFYFPRIGERPHYPIHVGKNEKYVVSAPAVTLKVVAKLSKIDKASWDYISQHGTAEQVIGYMNAHNLNRINLARIAWRVKDKEYFQQVIAILSRRHVYNHTLFSYGIKHTEVPAIREFLQHCNSFVKQTGEYIDSVLLTIDPVIRRSYQHMEYFPLVNARAHRLGRRRKIVNERLSQQYHRLLKVLGYRPKLDDDDLMAVTYYMLLQDRVEDGLGFFGRVNARKLATGLQYDYFTAYVDFFNDRPKAARKIVDKYKDYPVDRWRNLFAAAAGQLDEIEGKAAKVIDKEDRTQIQTGLADTAPSFDFKVEKREITLNYQNLKQVRVNYYLMDIELLFSRNPFVQTRKGQFSYIRPNATAEVKLREKAKTRTFRLPAEFRNSNVLVEIVAGGVKRSQAYYSHSLALQMIENYGQVRVTDAKAGKPLAKTYVKVYARMRGGRVRFYKDGYTDLRGRFDYTSLNTGELDAVEKFSLLIFSDTHGAVVREASPPKR